MTDIAPCPRCHYGAGPQGAERYWEARWRDEKAHNDTLVKALEEISELPDVRSDEASSIASRALVSSPGESNE